MRVMSVQGTVRTVRAWGAGCPGHSLAFHKSHGPESHISVPLFYAAHCDKLLFKVLYRTHVSYVKYSFIQGTWQQHNTLSARFILQIYMKDSFRHSLNSHLFFTLSHNLTLYTIPFWSFRAISILAHLGTLLVISVLFNMQASQRKLRVYGVTEEDQVKPFWQIFHLPQSTSWHTTSYHVEDNDDNDLDGCVGIR